MRSVFRALALASATQGDKIAFRDDKTCIGYRDLQLKAQGLAAQLQAGRGSVGILLPNGIDWVIASLATWLSGRRLVPLPLFFSTLQLVHICRDAGVQVLISSAQCVTYHGGLQLPVRFIEAPEPDRDIEYSGGGSCLIYTSGTTATPKGVVHGENQLEHMLGALGGCIGISGRDRQLSAMPFSLLLEQICSIYLPITVMAECVIAGQAGTAAWIGDIQPLATKLNEIKPSTLVLVPQLLSLWNGWLRRNRQRAPQSLRFVAVGGAPVSVAVLQQAQAHGIPVYEGYGLSECCSVVALNRPGDNELGSVGLPLPGIQLSIEAGEVIVTGPSVMQGYLGASPVQGRWATGDLGALAPNGKLFIYGRKDNVLCTANGRNISPEWIESRLPDDAGIQQAILTCTATLGLVLIIIPRVEFEVQFKADIPSTWLQTCDSAFEDLPVYARPSRILVCTKRIAKQQGLLGASGNPDRNVCARFAAERLHAEHSANNITVTGVMS